MTDLRQTIRNWWWTQIGNRDSSAARARAARLNRADLVAVLAERAVHDLARDTGLIERPVTLVSLVQVMAAVRSDGGGPLPHRLGQGDTPVLSPLRFERLLRAEGAELATLIRRALPMVDRACDVGALGADLCRWGDATRAAWAFRYHGANPPARPATDPPADNDEETEA